MKDRFLIFCIFISIISGILWLSTEISHTRVLFGNCIWLLIFLVSAMIVKTLATFLALIEEAKDNE